MGRWKEIVRDELASFQEKTGQSIITRQELLDRSLPRLKREFPNANTPGQTVSRELQELRDLGEVEFLDPGEYRIRSSPFRLGQSYRRKEIHDQFGGIRYTGIAPCKDYPYILLFTGTEGEEHGYTDEFRNDGSFIYSGEGQEGDMEFTRGNKAIRDHHEDGRELHLFESKGDGMVSYVGEYEYVSHFEEQLPDTHGQMRKAIRFKLVPAGGTETDIDPGKIESDTLEELYERAIESTIDSNRSQQTTSTTTNYSRSEIVKRYARARADGICRGCDEPAPFTGKNNEPFLEVHHMYRRSDGGLDHPDNVIAICPNCHRKVHEGKNGEAFNQQLIETVENSKSG